MKLISILAMLLILGGCTYHYSLHVSIAPPASPTPSEGDSEVVQESAKPVNPNPIGPQSQSGPMSIEPGQFTASQSKGGNMVNVILNLNLSKQTEVTTDASLSGVPGL